MKNERPFTIAVTGHRPDKLGGYSLEAQRRVSDFALRVLTPSRPELPFRVITGMAIGWDMAIASACVELKIPFLAAIPFEGQEKRWPISSQVRYRDLLSRAAKVQVICNAWSTRAFQDRNEWMVDNSDLLAALWSGSSGGTANCIHYAEANNRPLRNLWPEFCQFL